MKIITFESLPICEKIGVVTDWKRYIDSDYLKIETDRGGEIRIGADVYPVNEGEGYVPQSRILLGESYKITFVDDDKKVFNCGSIRRTGSRLMEIRNDLEACVIACHSAISEQSRVIEEMQTEIKRIKKELSISIV